MPSKFANQSQARQYNVSNAVASARIEGITPTKQLEQVEKIVCIWWTLKEKAHFRALRYTSWWVGRDSNSRPTD